MRYLEHRIFFGYSEKSDSLEIISFNDQDQRFEFQVVHQFSNPKKQELLYAERSQCLSCHFGSGPIFPITQWRETNADNRLAKMMVKEIGSNKYLRIPIFLKKQRPKLAFKMDRSVKNSYYDIITSSTIWNKICNSQDCRQTALLAAVANFCGQKDTSKSWETLSHPYLDEKKFSVRYGDPRLIDKDSHGPVRAEMDPREQTYIKMASATIVKDWPKLMAKIYKRLSGKQICALKPEDIAQNLQEVISENSFDPEKIVWASLGKKIDETFNLPPKKQAEFLVPPLSSLTPHKNNLENFRFFCGKCHSHPDELGFLNGSDKEVEMRLGEMSGQIIERLYWFKDNSAAQMPPLGSKEHEILKENKEFLQGFLEYLK